MTKSKKGPGAAPHRSLLYALGLTDEELKKPLIGIVSSKKRHCSGTYESGQNRRCR